MSYAEIMIQAYAEAKGITREEAIQHFGAIDLAVIGKKSTDQISDPRAHEILNDLRKDTKGVLAWAGNTE